MYDLCKDFHTYKFYDEEVWNKLLRDLGHKKRINNITFATTFYEVLTAMNKDPTNPFFSKLDKNIEELVAKHFNIDRQWRYDLE
jgi:hypothetical protein